MSVNSSQFRLHKYFLECFCVFRQTCQINKMSYCSVDTTPSGWTQEAVMLVTIKDLDSVFSFFFLPERKFIKSYMKWKKGKETLKIFEDGKNIFSLPLFTHFDMHQENTILTHFCPSIVPFSLSSKPSTGICPAHSRSQTVAHEWKTFSFLFKIVIIYFRVQGLFPLSLYSKNY